MKVASRCEGGRICLAYTLHRPGSGERLAGPHCALGGTGTDPPNGREKGAPLQTLRVCVRPPGSDALLAPAGGVPVHREAVEQEGRPALPHPPRPPSRVDRVRARLGPILAGRARGSAAREGRSPLGSPLPWGHGRGRREACGAPAASSLVLCPLRGPAGRLDPASTPSASAGSSAPDFRAAQAPDGPGPADWREAHKLRAGLSLGDGRRHD